MCVHLIGRFIDRSIFLSAALESFRGPFCLSSHDVFFSFFFSFCVPFLLNVFYLSPRVKCREDLVVLPPGGRV